MNRKIAILLVPIVCAIVAGIIFLIIPSENKSPESSMDSKQFDRLSKLIDVADSVRNAVPDSAMADYNKVIASLQNSAKDKTKMHLLARSYVGISNVNSEAGEYKLALNNDSIALVNAMEFDDKQMQAKSAVMRGTTLYRLGEYEKALNSYEKAEKPAIEINDLEIQAKIFSNRAMIWFHQGDPQKSIEGFRKALNIGKLIKNDPLIAGNYMNLSNVFNNLSKNDSVLIYNALALELFKKLNDKNGLVLCYRNLGNIYYDFADFEKAITNYELSLKHATELNDQLNTAKAYHNLAEIYLHIGDNATATDLLFKSVKIKEQLNDKLSLAKGYYGIGAMYYSRNEYPKSLHYFKKSLNLSLELKNTIQTGSSYNSIASIYCEKNKLDSAIFFYYKAMELYKKTNYIYGISNLCINLGDVYRVKKDYAQSEKLLLEALKTKTELEEEEGLAQANYYLANLYLSMSERPAENQKNYLLKKAVAAGLESYNIAKRIGALPVRKDVSKTLKKIYQQQNNYSKALEYSEISNVLSDSLLNKDKIQALTFAEARWNVEKKQQEINNLEQTQKLQQEIIHRKEAEARQHWLIIWFIAALFFLSVISTVIITMYIRKRRETIYQKQLASITALRMQNTRNTMSPHFFLNVLSSITGLSGQPERLKEKLRSLALLLRKMIENIDQTAIPLSEEIKAVKAYIDLYSDKIPGTFSAEYLIAEGTDLEGLIPAMMIQIPVENAIKHGLMPLEGDKILTISVSECNGYHNVQIEDNGIGLKASKGRSTGTGTGLKVLLQTIHLLNARNQYKINFAVENREPNNAFTSGTIVSIKIPNEFNYTL